MPKVAILVLADTESHSDLGRLVNALEAVKEFKEAGNDVQLIFDGAASKWPVELGKSEHRAHRLYESVKDKVGGVCSFCAAAFGVKEKIPATGARLLTEYDGHPSLRRLVSEGYQIITF